LARRPLDPLDMNAQGLEFLTDDALRHAPVQVLHLKPHTAVPVFRRLATVQTYD